jgi:ABC-2 type transport system permease protein
MKKTWTVARKDLLILLRDKGSLFWVVGFPLLMGLLLGAIFSGTGRPMTGMQVAAVDEDQTELSKTFLARLDSLTAVTITTTSRDSALYLVRTGKRAACVILHKGFGETGGVFGDSAMIEIGIDPARQTEAGYLQGMLAQTAFTLLQEKYFSPQGIKRELAKLQQNSHAWGGLDSTQRGLATGFLSNLAAFMETTAPDTTEAGEKAKDKELMPITVTPVTDNRARPRSGFEIFFPAALLWALIGAAASFSVSLVKERTAGTFLRLRIAPIRRAHILAGKGLACLVTCLSVCAVLLMIGNLIFGVRVADFGIIILAMVASSLAFVGIMMCISAMWTTEEAVGGAAWGILLVSSMIGGGMVPSIFMPEWMRTIGSISPVKWGILSFEGGIWRNFTLSEMALPVGILLGIGVVGYTIGVILLIRADR